MKIEDYAFGRIVIDGQTFTRDVILLPNRVWDGWWRQEGHRLIIADLNEIWAAMPTALVIGSGFFGLMQTPTEIRTEIERRGVALYIEKTRQACQVFNRLAAQGERVVAALHLSC